MIVHRHQLIERPAPDRHAWSAARRAETRADVREWLVEAVWCAVCAVAGALVVLAIQLIWSV